MAKIIMSTQVSCMPTGSWHDSISQVGPLTQCVYIHPRSRVDIHITTELQYDYNKTYGTARFKLDTRVYQTRMLSIDFSSTHVLFYM